MNTYFIWLERDGNFGDSEMLECATHMEAANLYLHTLPEHASALEFRFCIKQPAQEKQWKVHFFRTNSEQDWEHSSIEMLPQKWTIGCLLDQTIGYWSEEKGHFVIDHTTPSLYEKRDEAVAQVKRLREEEREFLKSKGRKHGDDDLDIFEDPCPVFDEAEFRRRPDTW